MLFRSAVAYLKTRNMVTKDLGLTGDSEKGLLLSEYTLEARQEAGNAVIADLV